MRMRTCTRTGTARPAGRPAGRPRRAAPRLASASATATATARPGQARPGEASERARVWFTVLLLPASQVVYTKSTF